jgi:hypothetical protein
VISSFSRVKIGESDLRKQRALGLLLVLRRNHSTNGKRFKQINRECLQWSANAPTKRTVLWITTQTRKGRVEYCWECWAGWRSGMAQWLIADISLSDVHMQLWMLLVTGLILLWFVYVWATR